MKKAFIGIFLFVFGFLVSCGSSGNTTPSINPTPTSNNPSTTSDISQPTTSTNSNTGTSTDPSTTTTSTNPTSNPTTTSSKEDLTPYINQAIETLDPYVELLISKIPYEPLKNDVEEFYEDSKDELRKVSTKAEIEPCVSKIKEDLEAFALKETKDYAIDKFDEELQKLIAKLPNESLKTNLQDFSTSEIEKINEVENIEDVPETLTTVISESLDYTKSLLATTVKDYISRLTAVETATAYDYLPAAMNPRYSSNLVFSSDISYDFNDFVNVSSIKTQGFGDQWQMVVENIEQSIQVAKVFNVAQTVMSSVTNAIDIYIENSYAETMNYEFTGDKYSAKFSYKDLKLTVEASITDVNVPSIGTVNPLIIMEYDILNDEKMIYLSLSDVYKLKYTISSSLYEMLSTYGLTIAGKSASRSTCLSIAIEDNKTTGHIYEYTALQNEDKIKACADFYVEGDYVSVVGNKSSGMVAFDGYINELYLKNEGKLLGYEVREELTISGVKGTYNTLWFNLWDINGINSVKVTDKSSANKSAKSTVDVYLNGSSKLLSPTYNTKLTVKTSRKYDIEFRNRYYYSYDATQSKYIAHEVKIPMLFIQEGDNYNSFAKDMKDDNNITASVALNQTYLNKILSDYDSLIDIFIENKEIMTSEEIIRKLTIE